jgi:hypothetical protein
MFHNNSSIARHIYTGQIERYTPPPPRTCPWNMAAQRITHLSTKKRRGITDAVMQYLGWLLGFSESQKESMRNASLILNQVILPLSEVISHGRGKGSV